MIIKLDELPTPACPECFAILGMMLKLTELYMPTRTSIQSSQHCLYKILAIQSVGSCRPQWKCAAADRMINLAVENPQTTKYACGFKDGHRLI